MTLATAGFRLRFFMILVTLAMLLPAGSWATNFCVGTASELQSALNTAAANLAADTVKIKQGTYTGTFTFISYEPYGLTIAGGYGTGCTTRIPGAANTTLDANEAGRPLYISETQAVDITIDSITLTDGNVGGVVVNSASSTNGGGLLIEASNAHVSISRSAIDSNYANGNGGGAYLTVDNGTVAITQTNVTNNTADSYGGGLYVDAGYATYTANEISDNTASSNGGGVYMPMDILRSANFDDNTFDNNTAGSAGGAIALENWDDLLSMNTDPEITDTLTLTGNTITNNTANHGGGVLFQVNDGIITASGNIINSNTAEIDGGGLYVYGHSTANLANNTINSNTASDGSGGGVYSFSWNGNQTLTGNTINSNTADGNNGGGAYIDGDGSDIDVVFTDNTLDDNTVNGTGGGVDISNVGDVTFTGNTITNNTSDYGMGGGAGIQHASTATVEDNEITGNDTFYYGGAGIAMYSVGSSLLTDNTITGNTFDYNTIANIAENGYLTCGGGVMVYGLSSETTFTNNDISDNIATYANGGGACIYVVDAILIGNNLDNNSAGYDGGGAWVYASGTETAVLVNNVASDNTAGNNGGGLYIDGSGGYTYLTNNTITDNNANDGGGLYVEMYDDSDSVDIYNNIFWENTASDNADDLLLLNDEDANGTASTSNLFNNDFDHDASGFYATMAFTPDASNLDKVDPVFVDADNDDYHLAGIYSVVVDAGDNDAPEILATDKDGNDRIMLDAVDMGAYEWLGAPPVPDVKANGSDGPVIVLSSTTVTVTAALDAGTHETETADWYLMATAASGKYWLTTSGWVKSATPLLLQEEALTDIGATVIFSGKLPKGSYSVVFTIDLGGTMYSDTVYVNVL
ncbi:MAG: right-handed parallel beta-helix repeat-containing protein [Deltaproteobacteria bacterium]|nr:right-handed parallel beta-helix repeat-containing protein [Deltaproteobacteria bacterium]